jgi:tetratricopeptide (TPR) repeat protein
MYKPIFLLLANFLFSFYSQAQSPMFEKNKVLEFFQEQEYDEATAYLMPAFLADSANLQLLQFLGYANYMKEDMKAAEEYYSRIFRIDSNNITAIRNLAQIKENTDLPKAVEFTSRLVRLQPGKSAHYRNMGELLKRKNEKDAALFYYHHAYQLAAGDYRNAAGLADLLLDKKQNARADSILIAALLKDSLNISLLKLQVRSAYESKNYGKAIPPGEKLVTLQETPVNALTQLVLSYYNLKMYKDCIRVCEYMLANNLDIEAIYYYEAKAWAKINEYEKSNDLLRICLDKAISKDAEMYFYSLGQNYEALKLYKKAVSYYDTAYYLFKDPVMNYNIGGIYEINLRNDKLAYLYYSRYLATANPVTPEEKKAYEYVRSKQQQKKKNAAKTK